MGIVGDEGLDPVAGEESDLDILGIAGAVDGVLVGFGDVFADAALVGFAGDDPELALVLAEGVVGDLGGAGVDVVQDERSA